MATLGGVREAQEITKLGISTIYALAKQNKIPHVRFGERAIRFPLEELERWVEEQVRRPSEGK